MDVDAPAIPNAPLSIVTTLLTPVSPHATPLRHQAPILMDATALQALNVPLLSAILTLCAILTALLSEILCLMRMDALALTTLNAHPPFALMLTFAPLVVRLKMQVHILTYAIAPLTANVSQGTA